MKAEDLMIGDLILHEGKVIRVNVVHKRKIGYHKIKDKLTWLFSGQFEPIPLTPEILDKNADFHRDEKYYKYYAFSEKIDIHGNSISVEICESRGTVYWTINGNEYGITKLKYVHELQHALKLCGIDKEIVV